MTNNAEASKALQEREDAVAQRQRLDSAARVAALLQHEFNNLMQTVMGALQVIPKLIGAGRIAETERFTKSALLAAQTAIALNQRVLRLSRPHTIRPQPLAINDAIIEIVETLHHAFPRAQLQPDLAPDLWQTYCDRYQFEVALLDLLLSTSDGMRGTGVMAITTRNQRLEGPDAALTGMVAGAYVAIEISNTSPVAAPGSDYAGESRNLHERPTDVSVDNALYRFVRHVGGCAQLCGDSALRSAVVFLPRFGS